MASRRELNIDEIVSILENDDDSSPQDSDSDEDDCVSQDDVRSDVEDAMVDFIEETGSLNNQEDSETSETKGGVDSFDQMCSSMSSNRKTNRWPMAVFYGMLNMSFVNSYIIYCHNMVKKNQKPLNRKDFMKKLSTELTAPWMQRRLEAPTLQKNLRNNITNILKTTPQTLRETLSDEPEPKKRRYCGYCSYKKKRMTKTQCYKCKKAICGEHNIDVCQDCV